MPISRSAASSELRSASERPRVPAGRVHAPGSRPHRDHRRPAVKYPQDAYELVDHNDVLQIMPRHKKPCSDDLVLRVLHRTTRGGRAVLIERGQAEELRDWLTRWLAEGWDGVRR